MSLWQVLLVAFSYLIGAIPFAYIIVKLVKKVDIRTVGSGNAGATNAARILGQWGFISVFICDSLKGFIPVIISMHFYGESTITLITAAVVVLGHTYTVFLDFKGGKGVATGTGVFLALAPYEIGISLIAFVIVFYFTRMVSAGSIAGGIALFIAVFFMSSWTALKILTGIIVLFIIFMHRSNIKRIISGEENRFIKKQDTNAE